MIPLFMRLGVSGSREGREKGKLVNLWLPLFLLWVLLLPFGFVILAVWAVSRLAGNASPGALRLARLIEAGAAVLWKIKGLRIDVRSCESRFVLHF